MSDAIETGERFFKAIEKGDIETVRNIYHPNVEIWHNTDGLDRRKTGQSREENVALLKALTKIVKDWEYDVWYREVTETGFVQQHVLRGELPNGEMLALPVCIIFQISDGQITRLDEYFDSAMSAPLKQAAINARASLGIDP